MARRKSVKLNKVPTTAKPRGRPRLAGKRTPSGQLSRAQEPARIPGNDRAEFAKSVYRGNGMDPIGRAYERGFLGQGNDAKSLLDTARAINRAYWAWYANGPIRCCLADRNSGADIDVNSERERRQEQWLNNMLRVAARGGRNARVTFDQLVIDVQPDNGPAWLDRLIEGPRRVSDWGLLATALDLLADCAGVDRVAAKRKGCA